MKKTALATTLTTAQALELKASGHVLGFYPRKGIIVVDGFKRFHVTDATMKAAR